MVLQQRKPSVHNEMLGRRQTTLADAFSKQSVKTHNSPAHAKPGSVHASSPERPAKRRRLSGPGDADTSTLEHHTPRHSRTPTKPRTPVTASPRSRRKAIPDSESENEDEDVQADELPSTQPTDLEQALPAIKTDKEAIEEYEALRAAESASELQERLGSRKWVEGKSSIYVDAFNLALETVLEEESHLFDDAENKVFKDWRELSYEAQYLYVRLFLRKTAAWHRINKLGYYSDIGDMEKAVAELFMTRRLPSASQEAQISPGEDEAPEGTVLGEAFTFADCSTDHITSLEEASTLLLLDELKALAKDAKLQGKNKADLLKALRRTSGKQRALGFGGLKRSDTEESVQSAQSEGREESPFAGNRDEYYLRKILEETGTCIRLSPAPFKLFERVHLVFYRSTEWTEKSLTTIILARIARRNFPEYIVSRSANIFPSRALLLEFEASVRTQFRIDNILEFNGTPTKDGLQEILDVFEEVYPRWQTLVAEEQKKEDSIYATGEGAYLRRLSPAWVYTRIVHKGAYVLGVGKFKHHEREHEILTELLSQRLFHHSRRGQWYQRKALLEEHYKHTLSPLPHLTPEQNKKHWKRVALRTCEEGLQDNLVHLIYHHDLQKRIVKLERHLRIPKSGQHSFGHALLAKPVERTFTGTRLERPPPGQRRAPVPMDQRRLSLPAASDTPPPPDAGNVTMRRGAKTLWLDPAIPPETYPSTSTNPAALPIVSVESMCLSHYRSLGWKGFHTEGGVLRTLFALCFHDVLFLYLPNVFQTPYQTCPLDLHTDGFYEGRLSEINARLAQISNGEAERIVTQAYELHAERKTCIVGLRWDFELADLQSIARSFKGEALAAILRVECQEYAQRGGGVPDLFLWREAKPPDDWQGPVEASGASALAGAHEHGEMAKAPHLDGNDDNTTVPPPRPPPSPYEGIDTKPYDSSPEAEILFAEVKSANDRLSDTQRLWIDVLMDAGVRVELCHAEAGTVRQLDC